MNIPSIFEIDANGTLVSYRGPGGAVTIPEGVTAIGSAVFQENQSLTHITVPEGVQVIPDSAFKGCGQLDTVNLPDSLLSIGDCAFMECFHLCNIRIPEGVTSIGRYAFCQCHLLTDITIPPGVTVIPDETFLCCTALYRIRLHDGITRIGANAFLACSALTELTLPSSLTSLGPEAFARCTHITSISIPEGVTVIPFAAFSYCTGLRELEFHSQVIKIGERAFCDCRHLSCVNLSHSVTSIGAHAFSGCDNLLVLSVDAPIHELDNCLVNTPSLKLLIAPAITPKQLENAHVRIAACLGYLCCPERYTDPRIVNAYRYHITHRKREILSFLFHADYVDGLSRFAAISRITADNYEPDFLQPAMAAGARECVAFLIDWKNRNLSPEDLERHMMRELSKDPFNITDMRKIWSYKKLPDGSVSIISYKGQELNVDIPPRIGKAPVTAIAARAFDPKKPGRPREHREVLQKICSVTIPEGVTGIGAYAFYECPNLTTVSIPHSVTAIENFAFARCSKLESVTISGSEVSIGDHGFFYCSQLNDITIHGDLIHVGMSAFEKCTGLTSVSLSGGDISIEYDAFKRCYNLAQLQLPRDGVSMDSGVFQGCFSLKDQEGFVIVGNVLYDYYGKGGCVVIPQGVTAISTEAFCRINNITEVTVPHSVTWIDNTAFYQCLNLSVLNIPAHITNLANAAFKDCIGLADPEGFLVVNHQLFEYDGNAADITVPDTVTYIHRGAFTFSPQLHSVTVHSGVAFIAPEAFDSHITLCAPLGSVAAAYAEKANLPFRAV